MSFHHAFFTVKAGRSGWKVHLEQAAVDFTHTQKLIGSILNVFLNVSLVVVEAQAKASMDKGWLWRRPISENFRSQ
jgi:hypothetical protein